jgi:hypothetical protein
MTKKLVSWLRISREVMKRREIAEHREFKRQNRIALRSEHMTTPQEKDRWPANWKPLTIAELFDR